MPPVSSSIQGCYVGSQPASGIYLGSTQIWQALDADAAAYIAAIVAQGATVTGAQRTAISEFVAAEKSASRWTGLKRFYLPVWGVAAANAICMKSLTSGTFVGGVTHGAGFVQGNGTTGYFDLGVTPNAIGMTTGSGSLFAIITDKQIGVSPALVATQNTRIVTTTTSIQGRMTNSISGANLSLADGQHNGVVIANRKTTTSLVTSRRNAAGIDSSSVFESTNATAAESVYNAYAMGRNSSGSAIALSTTKFGLYGMGLGIDDASAFTLNLKTLWETVTGLTLP